MSHEEKQLTIDVHAHYFPQTFLDLIAKYGPDQGFEYKMVEGKGPQFKRGYMTTGPVSKKFIDLDTRLAAMDAQGVTTHVLSLSQPMVYWASGDLARLVVETYNDALAEAHQRHPERLFGLASLPMHEPQLAVKEAQRVAQLPGIRGFYMATNIQGKDLADASFLPIYEAVESTRLPIFLHPLEVIGHERLGPHYLTNLLGNPFESAIAAAHLIFGGVLDRFPNLVICLPHSGGAFPFLVGRLNRGWQVRADLKHIKQAPIDYLRRFYYDTVGYSDDVLEYVVRVVGADRVMMGSDYCFPIAYEQPVKIVTDHPKLDAETKRRILEGNARQLLKI